ncbi:MAG TPA: BON domain-containing protein [Aridibacter sp.]|nr:BON domain-containing protein [Aridibacter sp.]
MKSIRSYLIIAIVILGISVTSISAQTAGSSVLLENKVAKELRKLPYYGVFDHIAFEVEGSTVTLYGKVLNGINKNAAEAYVEDIDGVTEVVNKIDLLPPSNFDDSIRRRTVRAFVNSGSIYRYLQGTNPSVRIIVEGGRMTLEGVVNSRSDVNFANIVAQGVPGVFKVTNNLTVATERP